MNMVAKVAALVVSVALLAHAKLEHFDLETTDTGKLLVHAGDLLWLYERHKCLTLVRPLRGGLMPMHLNSGHRLSYLQYNKPRDIERTELHCGFMIIALYDTETIVRILRDIRHLCQTSSNILVATSGANPLDEYKKMFRAAWRMRLKHVAVLEDTSGTVITFDPYSNKTYLMNVTDEEAIRSRRHFRDYQGATMKATLFESLPNSVKLGDRYVGVDPMVMRTFAEKLNVSIVHFEPEDGQLFGNVGEGNATGAFAELYSGNADIAFNQAFIKHYRHAPEIAFTDYILPDNVCVVVPRAPMVPSWMYITYTMSWSAGAAFLAVTATSCLVLLAFRRITVDLRGNQTKNNSRTDFSTTCIDILQLFIGVVSPKAFPDYLCFRIFLATLILMVFVLNTALQSALMTVVTRPKHFSDINTVGRLEESGNLISTHSAGMMDIFEFRSKTLSDRMRLLPRTQPQFPARLSRISRERYDMALGIATLDHVVAEYLEHYLQAYVTLEDPYFGDDLNRIIQQIRESGLTGKWYADTVTNSSRYFGVNREPARGEFPRAFKLEDVYSGFAVLGFGLTLGTIAFIGELTYHRYYYIRKRLKHRRPRWAYVE